MSEQPFTAALTSEQAEEGERISQSDDPIRRMGMAVLTRNSEQLSAAFGDGSGEAYLELAESPDDYRKRLLSEADLMQSAWARLMTVMQAEIDRQEASA